MADNEQGKAARALLAFGRRVSADDTFAPLVAGRGWRRESWEPTFLDAFDRESYGRRREVIASGHDASPWGNKLVLRSPNGARDRPRSAPGEGEPRLMVASADELPTLYFVEWHYIDFVLSCVGNVSETARILGIRRSTLQRKRKKSPPER